MSSKPPGSDATAEDDEAPGKQATDALGGNDPDDAFESIVWTWDLDADELWWGPAFEDHFGWDPAALPSAPSTWFDRIHPDDRERVVTGLEEAIDERQRIWADGYRLRRADGSYTHVRDRAHLLLKNGKPVGLAGAMTDLSEIHEAQAEIQRRLRQQSLLADLGGQAVANPDPSETFELATLVLQDGLDIEYAAVLRHRPERSDLLIEAEAGWTHLEAGTSAIPDERGSQSGYTLAQRGTVILEDTEKETRFDLPDPLHEHGARSGMTVPIRTSRGTWGVLAAHDTKRRSFDEDDIALLDSVAAILGSVVERDRARERFELVTEATSDILWEYEITTDAVWFSPMLEKVFGWDPDRFEAFEDWAEIVHPDDIEEIVAGIDRWLEDGEGTWQDEYRLRRADGGWANVHDHASLVKNEEGDPIRAVGSIADRTEEFQAQERLRLQARMLAEIGQAVVATDPDGRVTFWNEAAEEIYGWTEEEALGRNVMDLTVPSDRTGTASEIMAALAEGDSWIGEFELRRKDGSTFPAIVSDTPLLDQAGELVGVIGVATDISEQKETERALAESRERLDHLIRETPAVIFTADPEPPWDVRWMCSNIAHVLGEPEYAFEREPQLWWERVPDEDREHLRDRIAELTPGGKVSIEHRWSQEGEIRWLRTDLRLVDGDGQAAREIVGSSIDITGRVEVQEALAESEQRFREMAENIDSVFWINKPTQDDPLYISPGYEKIWGRPTEDLEDDPRAFADAVHPEDRDRFEAYLEEQRSTEAEVEYRIVRPDGEVRWVRDRAFPVRDDDGEVVRLVGVVDDVTERRRLEEALREREERMRFTIENTPTILFSIDPDGFITLSRGAGLERLGLEPAEAVGQHVTDLYGDRPDILEFVEEGLGGSRVREILEVGDGWMDVEVVPRRDGDGELVAVDGIALDVTKRVRAQRELEENRRRLDVALQGLPMILFTVSPEGRFTLVEGQGLEDPDVAPQEAVGKHVRELYGDNEQVMRALERVLDGEEFTTQASVGNRVLQVQCSPTFDEDGELAASHGVAIDVTEQVEAQRELEGQRRMLEVLAENVHDVLWVVDTEDNALEYISPGHEDMWGTPVEVAYEDPDALMEHVHPEDRDRLIEAFETGSIVGEPGGLEYRIVHPDRGIRYLRTTADVAEWSGETYLVGVTRDVTTEKEAQRAREERIQAKSEIERLEEINRFKTDFLNTSAHELSNPITPMRLQLEALISGMLGELTDDQEDSLELVERNLGRLQRLVDDLLDASRLQQGRLSIDPTTTDLAKVVADVVGTLRPEASAKETEISTSEVEPVTARVDRDRISQVLHNLLDNAVKYTPRQGSVSVSLSRENDDAVLTVQDTGIGLTPSQLDRLFTAFTRVHEGEHDQPGTGLGLYISEGLVEAHGGTIEADSDGPGEGATFTVRLPLGKPPSDAVDRGGRGP